MSAAPPPPEPGTGVPDAPGWTSSAMPELALPFAWVGAAAGWLLAALFSNPLLDLAPPHVRGVAAVVGAVVGALAGATLTRWCRPSYFFGVDLGGTAWRTAVVVAVAGGVAGSLAARLALPRVANATELGLVGGLVAAALFYPVALLVVGAARRAARARLGSVVASCDRREVWTTLAASLGVATVLATPSWLAEERAGGAVGAAVAVVAAVVVAVALVADRRAGLRLNGLVREADALVEVDAAEADRADVPRLDVGLGDEARARTRALGSAYRAERRTIALVVGDLARASAAVGNAVARKRRGLSVLGAAVALHALGAHPDSPAWFESARCRLGRLSSCEIAGDLARRAGDGPAERARAADLYRRGCLLPRSRAGRAPALGPCRALLDMIDRGEVPAGDRAELAEAHRVACDAGDGRGCRLAAHEVLGAEPDFRKAARLLSRACRYDGGIGCAESRVLEALCRPALGSDELRCPGTEDSPGNLGRAALQATLRCLEGSASECEGAADPSSDDRVAAAVLELGCAHGAPSSCERAADLESTRLSNEARASDLYARACAGGSGLACCEQAARAARAHPDDEEAARRPFERAAAAGYARAGACAALGAERGWIERGK